MPKPTAPPTLLAAALRQVIKRQAPKRKRTRHVFGRRKAVVQNIPYTFTLTPTGLLVRPKWGRQAKAMRMTFYRLVQAAQGQGEFRL